MLYQSVLSHRFLFLWLAGVVFVLSLRRCAQKNETNAHQHFSSPRISFFWVPVTCTCTGSSCDQLIFLLKALALVDHVRLSWLTFHLTFSSCQLHSFIHCIPFTFLFLLSLHFLLCLICLLFLLCFVCLLFLSLHYSHFPHSTFRANFLSLYYQETSSLHSQLSRR